MSEYLSAADSAKILGCSDTLIRKRIQSGDLPATKWRGAWRILRADLDCQARPHVGDDPEPQNRAAEPQNRSTEPDSRIAEPENRTTEPNRRTELPNAEWRDDLLAQVARLEADKVSAGARLDEMRSEAGLREERSKARIIDLERELTVRDSRMADMQDARESDVAELRGQVAVLEAKVRETLEERAEESGQLANRIADLVTAHQEMHARVIELQPVAEQVPMLQAAVEEKDAALTERDATLSEREKALADRERELGSIRSDIDAIASRPVAGPVFRLITRRRFGR